MTIEPRPLTAERRAEIEAAAAHWYRICAGDTSLLVYSHRVGVELLAALIHAEQERDGLRDDIRALENRLHFAEPRLQSEIGAENERLFGENEALRQRIAELEAGLRDIGGKPILHEANPYAEIENLQLKAWSVLEATP